MPRHRTNPPNPRQDAHTSPALDANIIPATSEPDYLRQLNKQLEVRNQQLELHLNKRIQEVNERVRQRDEARQEIKVLQEKVLKLEQEKTGLQRAERIKSERLRELEAEHQTTQTLGFKVIAECNSVAEAKKVLNKHPEALMRPSGRKYEVIVVTL